MALARTPIGSFSAPGGGHDLEDEGDEHVSDHSYGVIEAGSGHLGHITWAAFGPTDSPLAPAVLVHGLGDSSACWPGVVEHLAAERLVIVTDLRGHGGAPLPDGPVTVRAAADDLAVVVHRVAQRPAALVGHSLGALVAQEVALRGPALTAALVLEDPAWSADEESFTEVAAWLHAMHDTSYARLLAKVAREHPDWSAAEAAPWAAAKRALDLRVLERTAGLTDRDWVESLTDLAPDGDFLTTVLLGQEERGSAVPSTMAERAEVLLEGKGQVLVLEAGHDVRRDQRAVYLELLDAALVQPGVLA